MIYILKLQRYIFFTIAAHCFLQCCIYARILPTNPKEKGPLRSEQPLVVMPKANSQKPIAKGQQPTAKG